MAPDRERSWVGKAITRFEPISTRDTTRGGIDMVQCSGYPADAVQLGVHSLYEDPPELVVSGINLGYNHGAGFLVSSGTVGAAIEGWVSGVGSIAFSTGAGTDDWHSWRRWLETEAALPGWTALAEVCAGMVDEIVASGMLGAADVVSVNLPFDATPATERRVTSIARVGYDRLFRHVGDGVFVHDFGGGIREFAGLRGSDVEASSEGVIAVTPIRMPEAAELNRAIVERFSGAPGSPAPG